MRADLPFSVREARELVEELEEFRFCVVELDDGGATARAMSADEVRELLRSTKAWREALKEFNQKNWRPGVMMNYPCEWIFAAIVSIKSWTDSSISATRVSSGRFCLSRAHYVIAPYEDMARKKTGLSVPNSSRVRQNVRATPA